MTNKMNSNTKQDPSNLNISSNLTQRGNDGGGGVGSVNEMQQGNNGGDQPNMSNLEYLKNLAGVMANQGGGDGNNSNAQGQSTSSSVGPLQGFFGNNNNNNNNDFQQMQNNGASDTDTCASSQYNMRRVSRDSIVSHSSLSDMLSADQVASNNLAMMNMLTNQQQNNMGGGNQNNNNFGGNNFNNNQQQQHQQNQALNQSMSQLMMNGSMGMNTMAAASMMNNSMGGAGWNNGNGNGVNMNDPSLLGAYGLDGGGGTGTAPLLIPPKKTKNKHKQTFAQKLMHILSIKECQDAIRWMPNGCAFCIVDSKELVDKVLPKYFKEAKYTSFTRKLNRWGFKHFTLPTSEPNTEKEMSIYTHEKFLRDNPTLCQQMDGGHRRRNSQKESQDDTVAALTQAQGTTGNNTNNQDTASIGQFQQNMMMQQMQQLQQQNMMIQQLQAHQQQLNNQNNQAPMFDMSALNNMGGGNGNTMNAMMGSFNNNSNAAGLMGNDNQGGNNNDMNGLMDSNATNAMGMRRTSLGFMPYLPATNRRGSGFSTGGLSTISNDLSSSFNMGGNGNTATALGGLTGSTLSLEKFRKMSPTPTAMNNATFDLGNAGGATSQQGEGKTAEQQGSSEGKTEEGIRHSQAKLAVLEDMIAKERRKQSLLSSLDSDPATM